MNQSESKTKELQAFDPTFVRPAVDLDHFRWIIRGTIQDAVGYMICYTHFNENFPQSTKLHVYDNTFEVYDGEKWSYPEDQTLVTHAVKAYILKYLMEEFFKLPLETQREHAEFFSTAKDWSLKLKDQLHELGGGAESQK